MTDINEQILATLKDLRISAATTREAFERLGHLESRLDVMGEKMEAQLAESQRMRATLLESSTRPSAMDRILTLELAHAEARKFWTQLEASVKNLGVKLDRREEKMDAAKALKAGHLYTLYAALVAGLVGAIGEIGRLFKP